MTQITMASRPGGEQERTVRAHIDAAGELLHGERGEGADALVALLFGRAAPEDVIGYEAAELAALAREAFAFLATRKP
jgi:glutamate dehydrogenase